MIDIKVLGPGCQRCQATESIVREMAQQLGLEVNVEKITDYVEIANFGIVSTPAIVINGNVVHAGGLPNKDALKGWLLEY